MVRWTSRLLLTLAIALPAAGQGAPPPLVPDSFELALPAKNAIEQEWLTPDERARMRIFHGVWSDDDLDSLARRAHAALLVWDLDNPVFADPAAPAELRAEAAARRGDLREALAILEGTETIHADRIRAEALEELGDFEAADKAVEPAVNALLARRLGEADSLTEGVRSLIVRSRLRGQPARDYQTMLNLLAQARSDYDRLHWPAVLTEAELLIEKDNWQEAVPALHQTLSLNPRCSEAWYDLGLVALERFDFDAARSAVAVLRSLNETHPLADLLEARTAIVQNDPALALSVLDSALERNPLLRRAHALRCAGLALLYDKAALDEALAAFDELSPGSALAYALAGEALSFDRQYEWAADLLSEAIRRQTKWPRPRIELALLEMQSGRDALALAAMRELQELDRFNVQVANSLHLLESLADYKRIETEHFIVRYSHETDDQVMVDLMPAILERIHATVAGRFEHDPGRKTVIELMPNHAQFAVRITGMPHIHTIAACTGPVIAMEVPREGRQQEHFGIYDWPRVIQHEYTHTITLSQTRNRIPHWLTEAAAVSMELKPRDFKTTLSLVNAFEADELFDLDEINWAFIRPKRPGDRSLAYAQGHWMVEFMNERFGMSALIRLLERYFDGEREQDAIPNALGISRDEFYQSFLVWAGEQVKSWGFLAEPTMESLEDKLRAADPGIVAQMEENRRTLLEALVRHMTDRIGTPSADEDDEGFKGENWPELPKPDVEISHEQLADWLEEYPNHPDLVLLAAQRSIAMASEAAGEPGLETAPILMKYAELRPVDPMPHRYLALIWQNSETPERAIPHLEYLDAREQYSNVYATALARMYRDREEFEKSLEKVARAININPYDAPGRELAAAIAIKAGDLAVARTHIVALTVLEPERPQHAKRLAAIEKMIADRE